MKTFPKVLIMISVILNFLFLSFILNEKSYQDPQNKLSDVYLSEEALFDFAPGVSDVDITGLVTFDNPIDQPKTAKQYFRIQSLPAYDSNGNQRYILTDIVKMNYLSPKKLSVKELELVSDDSREIVFDGGEYGEIVINKITKQVVMNNNGEVTRLLTNDIQFEEFISKGSTE